MGIKSFIFELLKPLQIFLQRIGNAEPSLSRSSVDVFLCLSKPGDILLSYEKGRATSFFIKGYYDHAAIITSKITVMEAVGDKFVNGKNTGGVREVDLEEWLFKKDSVALIRPHYEGDIINKQAAATALYYSGKSYDYSFRVEDEKVYCSELVYLCYFGFDSTFMDYVDGEILPQEYYNLTTEKDKFKNMYFDLIYETKRL